MHECSAKCCANEQATLEETHSCIEKCSGNVHVAQNYVQKEVGGFQVCSKTLLKSCKITFEGKGNSFILLSNLLAGAAPEMCSRLPR